jgi:hypothetical protein
MRRSRTTAACGPASPTEASDLKCDPNHFRMPGDPGRRNLNLKIQYLSCPKPPQISHCRVLLFLADSQTYPRDRTLSCSKDPDDVLAIARLANAVATQALLNNLVERGLDPAVPRLFILDGAKALTKAVRATFGRHANPALPGSQGAQRCRALPKEARGQCAHDAAQGLGDG